jgi:predicted exporter
MILEKLSSGRSTAGSLQIKVTYRSQAGQAADKTMYTFTLEGASSQAVLDQLQRLNETLEHVVSITSESEQQC